jgi:hypothetical protein
MGKMTDEETEMSANRFLAFVRELQVEGVGTAWR